MKIGIEGDEPWVAEYYEATVVSAVDYYPFGSAMAGRKYNQGTYRFGFNGKEEDSEWGSQMIQDYGFRIYNPTIGKFLSVDPLAPDYPWNSTYAFAENDVVRCIDLDGLEKFPAGKNEEYKNDFPHFYQLITTGYFNNHILKSEATLQTVKKYSVGLLTEKQIKEDIGNGPFIIIKDGVFYEGMTMYGQHGEVPESTDKSIVIAFNKDLIENYEKVMNDDKSSILKKQFAQLVVYMTFLNEYVHYGDALDELDAIKDDEGNIVNGEQNEFEKGGVGFNPSELDEGNEAVGEIFGDFINSGSFIEKLRDAGRIYMRKVKGIVNGKPMEEGDYPSGYEQDPTTVPELMKKD